MEDARLTSVKAVWGPAPACTWARRKSAKDVCCCCLKYVWARESAVNTPTELQRRMTASGVAQLSRASRASSLTRGRSSAGAQAGRRRCVPCSTSEAQVLAW